jgi:hypothetical protein
MFQGVEVGAGFAFFGTGPGGLLGVLPVGVCLSPHAYSDMTALRTCRVNSEASLISGLDSGREAALGIF